MYERNEAPKAQGSPRYAQPQAVNRVEQIHRCEGLINSVGMTCNHLLNTAAERGAFDRGFDSLASGGAVVPWHRCR